MNFPKPIFITLFSLPNTLFQHSVPNRSRIYSCFVSNHNFEFPIVSNLYIYSLLTTRIIKILLASCPQKASTDVLFLSAWDLVLRPFRTRKILCTLIRLFLNTSFKSARKNCRLLKTFYHFAVLKYSGRVSEYSRHSYRKFELDGNYKSLLKNASFNT
jgi:hypothetical protein